MFLYLTVLLWGVLLSQFQAGYSAPITNFHVKSADSPKVSKEFLASIEDSIKEKKNLNVVLEILKTSNNTYLKLKILSYFEKYKVLTNEIKFFLIELIDKESNMILLFEALNFVERLHPKGILSIVISRFTKENDEFVKVRLLKTIDVLGSSDSTFNRSFLSELKKVLTDGSSFAKKNALIFISRHLLIAKEFNLIPMLKEDDAALRFLAIPLLFYTDRVDYQTYKLFTQEKKVENRLLIINEIYNSSFLARKVKGLWIAKFLMDDAAPVKKAAYRYLKLLMPEVDFKYNYEKWRNYLKEEYQ